MTIDPRARAKELAQEIQEPEGRALAIFNKPLSWFDERIERVPFSGCWIWMGSMSSSGYGAAGLRAGLPAQAYCILHLIYKGPHDQECLDHLCRVKACVNPDHLEPVSTRENTIRGISPPAQNSRKTHCKRGHPLEGENLNLKDGFRVCRECQRIFNREHKRRKYGVTKPRGPYKLRAKSLEDGA